MITWLQSLRAGSQIRSEAFLMERGRERQPMSEAAAKPERRKIWKYLLALALAGALVMTTLGWYSTTDSFRALVHERFIATLERMTGGRVELGSIHVVPFHFQVEVRNLTIHGREGAAEIPYFHASSLMAQIKILSLLTAPNSA